MLHSKIAVLELNDLNKEIEGIIKTIAKNNGYQTELLNKIIKNLENKKAKLLKM